MKIKTKKVLFIAVLFISILMLLAFTFVSEIIYGHQENNLEIDVAPLDIYYINIENSMSIVGDVLSNYRTEAIETRANINSNSVVVYNDAFAGVWYCYDGRLNIGITDMTEKRSEHPDVVYQIRQFSHNFLLEIHSAIANLMPNYSVFGVGIAPQYNRIEISLSDAQFISCIIRHLYGLSLFIEEAIKFTIEEKSLFQSAATSIHGGTEIRGGGSVGTISAKAICNVAYRQGIIRKGIITNAHVATAGAVMRCGSTNTIIGTREQYLHGGLADATFVPFDNQDIWEFTSSAAYFMHPNPYVEDPWINRPINPNWNIVPTTYQVANRHEIIAGLRIVQFGNVTGKTTGIISHINQSIRVEGRSFYDQIQITTPSYFGDSGSPVFAQLNGKYVLVATLFAGGGLLSGGMASKITNITSELDVTIIADVENIADSIFITNELYDGSIEIVGLKPRCEVFPLLDRLHIPSEINIDGIIRTITSIAIGAFEGRNDFSQITIPATISSIGNNALVQML
ncbi:MAG: S1 family peptidase [Defluviitaleaceae bacterium]|nr:S1 family peptidase [Defluviitaleaceae bacterium]